MQHRAILNRNHNFQFWTAGTPDNWNVTVNDGQLVQLDRHMPRLHPARKVFPKHLKANDLVKDGDFALRVDADGSSVDLEIESLPVACAPGMNLSMSLVYRYKNIPDGLSILWQFYDDFALTNLLASPLQPVAPPLVPAQTSDARQTQGMENRFEWSSGGSEIELESGGGVGPIDYWTRYGMSVEVPAGAFGMRLTLAYSSPDPTDAFDLDDFRLEALDSRVHAGG